MIDIREHGGSFGGNGLKATDKQALIDIVNNAESNQTTIKTNIATALNSKIGASLNSGSAWIDIQNAISNMTNKKWKNGVTTSSSTASTFTFAGGATTQKQSIEVTGLGFNPTMVIINRDNANEFTILFPFALSGTTEGRILTGGYNSVSSLNYPIATFKVTGGANVNNGFKLPVDSASNQYNWIAFE